MGRVYKQAKSEFWSIDFVDEPGKRVRESTKQPVQRTAERMLAKREERVAAIRAGLVDPAQLAAASAADRPIAEHFDAYDAFLQAKQTSPAERSAIRRSLDDFTTTTKVETLRGITTPVATQYLAELRQRPGRRGVLLATRTVKRYVTALRAFVRWCVTHDLLQRNPIATLPIPSGKREVKRRFLLRDEWAWLRDAAANGPIREGLRGPERALLYRTAIRTGYRVGELCSLRAGSLRKVGSEFALALEGTATKNGVDALQLIDAELFAALQVQAADSGGAELFARMPLVQHAARVLRHDLAAARANWLAAAPDAAQRKKREKSDFLLPVNAAGEVFDFHALRHTCGAWLMIAGVPIQVVQRIMRHSSITLTVDTYGHLAAGQESDAGRKLDELLRPERPDPPKAD